MALLIEDGTGIIGADSWATLAEADAYAASVGNTLWVDGDEELKEQALRRGVRYITLKYARKMAGIMTYGLDQTLPYPRMGVVLDSGIRLDDDYIPPVLKTAQIEAAFREFSVPGSLTPTAPTAAKKAVTVGPLSVTYADADRSAFVDLIEGYLFPLLESMGSTGVAFLKRA